MIDVSENLIKKSNEFYIKYKWEIAFIINSTGKIIRPKFLRNFTKVCNYESDLFAFYYFDCEIEDIYHKVMYEKQNDIICTIKLSKLYFYVNSVSEKSGYENLKPIYEEVIFDETFIPFFKNLKGTYVPSENAATDNADEKEPSHNHITDVTYSTVRVELNHFGTEEMNKKIYNISASNATVGDVLIYLLGENCADIKGAIIDPPDNNTKYPYIIIPPRNLRNSLHFLQAHWGIYLDSPIFFIDMGFAYILKQNNTEHEIQDKESPATRINIFQSSSSLTMSNVAIVEEERNNFYYNISQSLKRKDLQVQLGEIIPDTLIVSNFDKANNMLDVSTQMNQKKFNSQSPVLTFNKPINSHNLTKPKIAYSYDSTNNLYNANARVRKMSRKNFLQLMIGGADMESFTPNKKISLKVCDDRDLDAEFSHDYSIVNVIYSFTPIKSLDNSFLTTCSAILGITS